MKYVGQQEEEWAQGTAEWGDRDVVYMYNMHDVFLKLAVDIIQLSI